MKDGAGSVCSDQVIECRLQTCVGCESCGVRREQGIKVLRDPESYTEKVIPFSVLFQSFSYLGQGKSPLFCALQVFSDFNLYASLLTREARPGS